MRQSFVLATSAGATTSRKRRRTRGSCPASPRRRSGDGREGRIGSDELHAFARIVLDIREVFRTDSLGVLAWLHNALGISLSKWTGLAAIVPIIVIGSLLAPRTPSGFALLAGATHLTLYLFSTHAFCNERSAMNEYDNVLGALLCGVAAWDFGASGPEEAPA